MRQDWSPSSRDFDAAPPSDHVAGEHAEAYHAEIATLDPSALVELRVAGGRDFVALLIDQFLDESSALVAALRAALDRRDADHALAAAHQLRVCAQSIGVMRLASLCADLEVRLQSEPEHVPVAGIVRSIETELHRAQQALTAERAQLDKNQRGTVVKRPWEQ